MTELVDTWLHYEGRPIYGRTSRSGPHPDRPAILLVHGLVVSGRYLLPLAEELAGSFDVHVPDLPGFGRSPGRRQPLEVSDLADAIAGWLDAARIESAVLVANSFGCRLALEAAARHPDRARALVLQGPTTDVRARSAFGQLKRFARNAVHEPTSLFPLVVADYLKTAKRRVVETLQAAIADPIEEKLSQIFARTLIVSGEKDPISPPDWCRRLALEMPDAEHAVIEGGSHALVYNEPKLMARLIRHFVMGERFEGHPPVKAMLGDPPPLELAAERDLSLALVHAAARGLREETVEEPPPLRAPSTLGKTAGRIPRSIRSRRPEPIDADRFRKWVVDSYPARAHRAMFIGSTNGAIAQLAVAMGVPWLPQTFSVSMKCSRSKLADPIAEMEWGRRIAAPMLSAEPSVSVHHVYDPTRERAGAEKSTRFRLKLLELGTTYRTFIHRYLEPGGTIYVVDCEKTWPRVRLADRYFFQPGTVGGLAPEQYLEHNIRTPNADEWGTEAEWGFEPAILDDILELAQRRGYRVVRVSYEDPDDLSPMVADVISDWYRDMGFRDHHLLVTNDTLMDPWWAIRTCSVPFWSTLDDEDASDRLRAYLIRSERWRSADLMLPRVIERGGRDVEHWQEIIRRTGTGTMLDSPRALRQQVARREWPLNTLEPHRLDRWLMERPDYYQAEELCVPFRDVRTPVTLLPAPPAPISMPGW